MKETYMTGCAPICTIHFFLHNNFFLKLKQGSLNSFLNAQLRHFNCVTLNRCHEPSDSQMNNINLLKKSGPGGQ